MSRDVGIAGWSLGTRGALCLLVLLLGTASGVTLVWAKAPGERGTVIASSPVAFVNADDPESTTVTGEVVDPNGKPVEGASIGVKRFADRQNDPLHQPKLEQVATTDDTGRFKLNVKQQQFNIVAQKAGFGLDFDSITPEKRTKPIKLQLQEEIVIDGMVTNEMRNSIKDADIRIISVRRFEALPLEDRLNKVQITGNFNVIYEPSEHQLQFDSEPSFAVKSDAQGRFVLHGFPKGMMPTLLCNKEGMVAQHFNVVLLSDFAGKGTARYGLTALSVDESILKSSKQPNENIEQARQRLRGINLLRSFESTPLTIVLQRGVTLEGTVRNMKGEPVTGIGVMGSSGGQYLYTYTDSQGRYQFDGVTPSDQYSAQTGQHDIYLVAWGSRVHRQNEPIRIDLQVRPGTILRGQVVDNMNGRGVRSVISVKPTPGNPLIHKAGLNLETSITSKEDGTFRLVAAPGDVIISASAVWEQDASLPMPYLPAKILQSDLTHLQPSGNSNPGDVTFAGQGYNLGQAYQLLELATEGETTIELTLVRGKERSLKLVDQRGQPVDSALIVGLDQQAQAYEVKKSNVNVVGLQPEEKPRNVFIINREKKLGAYLTVDTTNTKPLVVKLEPLGCMSGQFLDMDSKPLKYHEISFAPTTQSNWKSNSFFRFFPYATTDQDGRVNIPDLIPHLKYVFYETNAFKPSLGTPIWKNKEYLIEPGQLLDLGVLKLGQEPGRKGAKGNDR